MEGGANGRATAKEPGCLIWSQREAVGEGGRERELCGFKSLAQLLKIAQVDVSWA